MHVALKIAALLLLFLHTFTSRIFFLLHLFYHCTFQWSSIGSIHSASHPTASTSVHASVAIPHCNAPTLHFSNERTNGRAHTHTYTYWGIATNCALPRRVTSRRTMPGRIHPTFAYNDRLNLPYGLHISPVARPDTIAHFHTQLKQTHTHTHRHNSPTQLYTKRGARANQPYL